MNDDEMIEKLGDNDVRFVTIEIIQNGFLVTLPEYAGKDNAKFHRVSLDGVQKLMARIWKDKNLITNTVKTKSDMTLDEKGKIHTIKKKVAKKVPKKK